MDVVEAIKTRKSIRCFKSDPVPKEVIAELLEIAGRAPSAMNTQPWEFMVLAGELLERFQLAGSQHVANAQKVLHQPLLPLIANGRDPRNPEDRNGDQESDGYANIEEDLNGLCPRLY